MAIHEEGNGKSKADNGLYRSINRVFILTKIITTEAMVAGSPKKDAVIPPRRARLNNARH